jgi:uncharacterized membrane protein YbhN (UPF0104 family)
MIKSFLSSKKIKEKPDNYLAKSSIALVSSFFIVSLIALFGIILFLIYLQIINPDRLLFIFIILFSIFFVIDVFVFMKIKKFLRKKSQDFVENLKKNFYDKEEKA